MAKRTGAKKSGLAAVRRMQNRFLAGIKQGVGAIGKPGLQVGKKNGNGRNNGRTGAYKLQTMRRGFDAFDKTHVALPRAIAPYAVVRTTALTTIPAGQLALLGTMQRTNDTDPTNLDTHWSSAIGYHSVNAALAVNAATNTTLLGNTPPTLSTAGTVTPAAFSVQIMNQNPLQTTSGVVMASALDMIPQLRGSTRTYGALAGELTSFYAPRLMSAGKLALRGVQIDAIPGDMNELSNFCRLHEEPSDRNITNDILNGHRFGGFAPIFIDNTAGPSIDVLVSVEWRVRFDPFNPAVSSHTHHHPSSDFDLGCVLRTMQTGAQSVVDIVQKVAHTGMMLNAMRNAQPAQLMIAD